MAGGASLNAYEGCPEPQLSRCTRRCGRVQQVTSLNSVTTKGMIRQSTRISYANPHYPLYFVAEPTGRAAKTHVNVPDPRTYRQYDHSSP